MRVRKGAFVSGALLFAGAFAATAADATVLSKTCAGQRFSFSSSESGGQTTSKLFTAVPGANVSFNIPGTVPVCIAVDFSAQAAAADGEALKIRAVLDGSVVAFPGEIALTQSGGGRSQAFTFVLDNVPPGPHTVRIVFRSQNGGNVVIAQHTTLVRHR